MTVRQPEDEDEYIKAVLALAMGRGRSVAEVIEEITGEIPDEATVEAVRNRLQMGQESNETVDIASLLEALKGMQNTWQ